MILWVVLFVLIVAISFILAVKSMRDFTETASGGEQYALFLIRASGGLNARFFNSIYNDLLSQGAVISFERLFRGKQSALVVFGPRSLLTKNHFLNLLELEDYTNVKPEHTQVWEVGVKNNGQWKMDNGKVFSNLPQLSETEQFWWQLLLRPDKTATYQYQAQIRAVLISPDTLRRKSLTPALQNLAPDHLFKLPKAFSNTQILDFYQRRSIRADNKNPSVSSEELLHLLN